MVSACLVGPLQQHDVHISFCWCVHHQKPHALIPKLHKWMQQKPCIASLVLSEGKAQAAVTLDLRALQVIMLQQITRSWLLEPPLEIRGREQGKKGETLFCIGLRLSKRSIDGILAIMRRCHKYVHSRTEAASSAHDSRN